MNARYRRVLLKLSGGAMSGPGGSVFDADNIKYVVNEVVAATDSGIQLAIMVGGGNIFRGRVSSEWNIDRIEADNMGMLGTIINAVMLRAALAARTNRDVRVMTALPIPSVAEPYIRLKALKHLRDNAIVILAGGIGQPFVTTDYPSIQRALELHCDAVLAAKDGVKGVYDRDPQVHRDARLFKSISYDDAIARGLAVMDQTALVLARENDLPISVYGFGQENALVSICEGAELGTALSARAPSIFA